MGDIIVSAMLILLFIAMAFLVIYPFYMSIVDSYYFKVQYIDITGHRRIEYFSIQAISLKRAYKKARNYINEMCMSHEYIDYISLI